MTPHGEMNRTVDVTTIVGQSRLTSLPILVLALAFLVIMVDGYDLICLAFVAPQLAKVIGIPVANFGPVFTAGYLGILFGGILIGPLADRNGRKIVLISSVALFGLCSLLPIVDVSYSHLLVYRFATGLGLGGAMPAAVALTTEYAPTRLRGLFANLMFAGVATGGVMGGFLASKLVPVYGWVSVFWIGGCTPLILVPLLLWLMPESISFLALNKRRPEYVAAVLNRLVGSKIYSSTDSFVVRETGSAGRVAVRELFADGRAIGTPLIWLTSFAGLLVYGLLSSWLPTFLTMGGATPQFSIIGPVVMNLGGILGTVLLGIVLTRFGLSPVIAISMSLTALALLLVSISIGGDRNPLLAIFATGLCVLGSITSTNTLMAVFYPTKIRATGVGWALGAGRVGGALGPASGGLLLSWQFSPTSICQLVALAAIVGACAVALVGVFYPLHRRSVNSTGSSHSPLPQAAATGGIC